VAERFINSRTLRDAAARRWPARGRKPDAGRRNSFRRALTPAWAAANTNRAQPFISHIYPPPNSPALNQRFFPEILAKLGASPGLMGHGLPMPTGTAALPG